VIYSVWNQRARAYDYYETLGATPVAVPSPSHLRPGAKLGIAPERAGWPRPGSARLVGRGAYARGVVAMGDDGNPDAKLSTTSKILYAAIGIPLALWLVSKA
jgi:hypothetical protein